MTKRLVRRVRCARLARLVRLLMLVILVILVRILILSKIFQILVFLHHIKLFTVPFTMMFGLINKIKQN
jgi:hypothetical protein